IGGDAGKAPAARDLTQHSLLQPSPPCAEGKIVDVIGHQSVSRKIRTIAVVGARIVDNLRPGSGGRALVAAVCPLILRLCHQAAGELTLHLQLHLVGVGDVVVIGGLNRTPRLVGTLILKWNRGLLHHRNIGVVGVKGEIDAAVSNIARPCLPVLPELVFQGRVELLNSCILKVAGLRKYRRVRCRRGQRTGGKRLIEGNVRQKWRCRLGGFGGTIGVSRRPGSILVVGAVTDVSRVVIVVNAIASAKDCVVVTKDAPCKSYARSKIVLVSLIKRFRQPQGLSGGEGILRYQVCDRTRRWSRCGRILGKNQLVLSEAEEGSDASLCYPRLLVDIAQTVVDGEARRSLPDILRIVFPIPAVENLRLQRTSCRCAGRVSKKEV